MILYVLRKSIGSYDDADRILCGVFDSQEKAIDHVKKLESVSDVPIDSNYNHDNTIWTESCFHDPIDNENSASYSISCLELNKGAYE